MASFDFSHIENRPERVVPASAREFSDQKVLYNLLMRRLRKKYAVEWSERRRRQVEAVAKLRAEIDERKRSLRAQKLQRKLERADEETRRKEERQLAKRARAEARRNKQLEIQENIQQQRREWLQALSEDSARWIEEEEIDDAITPDLFDMRYPGHMMQWYDAQTRRAARAESSSRPSVGVGLLEAAQKEGAASDDQYASDWESDEEASPLPDPLSPVDEMSRQGIQLVELYHQKPQREILRELKQWQLSYLERYADYFQPAIHEAAVERLQLELAEETDMPSDPHALVREVAYILRERHPDMLESVLGSSSAGLGGAGAARSRQAFGDEDDADLWLEMGEGGRKSPPAGSLGRSRDEDSDWDEDLKSLLGENARDDEDDEKNKK